MKHVLFPEGDQETGHICDILESVVMSAPFWRQTRERKEIALSILEKLPELRENFGQGLMLEDKEREQLASGMKLDGMNITPRTALVYFLQCSVAVDAAKTPAKAKE